MPRPSKHQMRAAITFIENSIRFRPPGSQAEKAIVDLKQAVEDYCELQELRDRIEGQELEIRQQVRALQQRDKNLAVEETAERYYLQPVLDAINALEAKIGKKDEKEKK